MDRKQRNILAGFLIAALVPAGLTAAEQWVKLTTPNFELYTTAGEKRGREAILYFEQVRSFFLSVGQEPLLRGKPSESSGLAPRENLIPSARARMSPPSPSATAAAIRWSLSD